MSDSRHHGGKKLPPGWVKCESSKYHKPYFFDTQSGESAWFPPEAPEPTSTTSEIQCSAEQLQQQRQHPDEGSAALGRDGEPPAKRSRRPSPSRPSSPSQSQTEQQQHQQHQEDGVENGGENYAASSDCAPEDTGAATAGRAEVQSRVKVAVIVPYRDSDPAQKRSTHLETFIPYMEDFLSRHAATFHVYVVEQSADDGRKFNRGKLLNVGFDMARKEGCDAFMFHDVDLLPSDELGRWYSTRPDRPVHVARVWKQYSNNPKYFGGVVGFNRQDFETINGFPNTFWGWGGEDDEMFSRIVETKLEPQKAEEGYFTDLEGLDLTTKLALLRKNEQWKCQVKQEVLEEHGNTWRQNGLADLNYTVLDTVALAENSEKVTVDVQANNHWTDTITHWKDLHKRNEL